MTRTCSFALAILVAGCSCGAASSHVAGPPLAAGPWNIAPCPSNDSSPSPASSTRTVQDVWCAGSLTYEMAWGWPADRPAPRDRLDVPDHGACLYQVAASIVARCPTSTAEDPDFALGTVDPATLELRTLGAPWTNGAARMASFVSSPGSVAWALGGANGHWSFFDGSTLTTMEVDGLVAIHDDLAFVADGARDDEGMPTTITLLRLPARTPVELQRPAALASIRSAGFAADGTQWLMGRDASASDVLYVGHPGAWAQGTFPPGDADMRWLTMADDHHGVLVVQGGPLYVTSDAGRTWTDVGPDRSDGDITCSTAGCVVPGVLAFRAQAGAAGTAQAH